MPDVSKSIFSLKSRDYYVLYNYIVIALRSFQTWNLPELRHHPLFSVSNSLRIQCKIQKPINNIMSMSNGRPKSKQNGGPKKENGTANGGSQNGKKAASATVYPILRPVQNQKVADVDVQEQCNGDRFAQGQVVKPKPAR